MRPKRAIKFLASDIWSIEEEALPKLKAFFLRLGRIMVLSIRGIFEDKCQLRASALTFYSVLSLVPVLAMVFGIAKGFGLERFLERQLLENMESQSEVVTKIIAYANSLLEGTRGGLMVGAGVLFLVWTILNLLSNIEDAFNDIWGIDGGRSIGKKLVDYIALTLIGPFLVIVSGTVRVMAEGYAKTLLDKIPLLDTIGIAIIFPLKLLPFVVMWVLFTFIYRFMPNTDVKFRSALVGGIVAGTLYHLFQWAYIYFQIGVARYNAIYGSFAALPLFLIWLNWSWLIVLYGAEISFAHQNVKVFEFEKEWAKVSLHTKKLLALYVVQHIVKNFVAGQPPENETEVAARLKMPIRAVKELLDELVAAGVISEVKNPKGGYGYQPGRNPETMTIASVLEAIEDHGEGTIPLEESDEVKKLSKALQGFRQLLRESPQNLKLMDI